jgi:hypothetical protein
MSVDFYGIYKPMGLRGSVVVKVLRLNKPEGSGFEA